MNNGTPTDELMRFSELTAWLGTYKVSEKQVRYMIDKGIIKIHGLGTLGVPARRLFKKSEIEQEIFPALGLKPRTPTL